MSIIMSVITASEVNKLRSMTGAGMMDCKKALTESNGNFEAAIDYLRKKGAKLSQSRADRDAKEGVVIARTAKDKKSGYVIEVNCETDFVAKNNDFISFANSALDTAIDGKVATLTNLLDKKIGNTLISDLLLDMTGKIGEKISISKLESIEAPLVVAYNHSNYRIGVLVGMNLMDSAIASPLVERVEEVGRDVSMQIAAMNPLAVDKKDVPQHAVERELEIAREQTIAEGKSGDMVEKIAQGKLNKFYKEQTLYSQEFVKDSSKTIAQLLDSVQKGLSVTSFKRIALGS